VSHQSKKVQLQGKEKTTQQGNPDLRELRKKFASGASTRLHHQTRKKVISGEREGSDKTHQFN